MTDSTAFSAATGLPTPVDDGTPAGHPTPAGEPAASRHSSPTQDSPDQRLAADAAHAIGMLVIAWGGLEAATVEKLLAMRCAFGDVRALGGRSRPTLQRLLAELRALVAMRDRHDKQALTIIAALDGDLQRLTQFREIVVDGTQALLPGALICHDLKNVEHRITLDMLIGETRHIEDITRQIAAL